MHEPVNFPKSSAASRSASPQSARRRSARPGTLPASRTLCNTATPNDFAPYGLSLDIGEWKGRVYLNKGGGVPGFRSLVGYLPDSGVSVALLANAIPLAPDLDVLMNEVLTLVAPR